MKTKISIIAAVALSISCATFAAPISEQKTLQHTYPVSSSAPRLYVRNIWGNVTVRARNVREITVTINEHRTAPTQALFERSKELLRLDVEASGDGVSMIVGDPHRDVRVVLHRGAGAEHVGHRAVGVETPDGIVQRPRCIFE